MDQPTQELHLGNLVVRRRRAGRQQREDVPPSRGLSLHASSSRPEGVAPLDGERSRRLGRRTLLLHLAKQVAAAVGSALFQLVHCGHQISRPAGSRSPRQSRRRALISEVGRRAAHELVVPSAFPTR